jgi:hypothetical protein
MIDNDKQNCIDNLCGNLTRTARWRRTLQAKYPADAARNARAAEKLDQLAIEATDLTDDAWSELKCHYSWASAKWCDAVSEVSRRVEFRGVHNLEAFIMTLVGILEQQIVAA